MNTKSQSVYQQPTQTSYNPSNVTFPSSIVQRPTTQLLPNPATMVPRSAQPTPPFLIHQADNTALLSAATSLESVTRELFTRPVTRKTAKVVEPSSESCTTTSISSSYLSSPKLTHEVSVQVTALESVTTQTDTTCFELVSSEPLHHRLYRFHLLRLTELSSIRTVTGLEMFQAANLILKIHCQDYCHPH